MMRFWKKNSPLECLRKLYGFKAVVSETADSWTMLCLKLWYVHVNDDALPHTRRQLARCDFVNGPEEVLRKEYLNRIWQRTNGWIKSLKNVFRPRGSLWNRLEWLVAALTRVDIVPRQGWRDYINPKAFVSTLLNNNLQPLLPRVFFISIDVSRYYSYDPHCSFIFPPCYQPGPLRVQIGPWQVYPQKWCGSTQLGKHCGWARTRACCYGWWRVRHGARVIVRQPQFQLWMFVFLHFLYNVLVLILHLLIALEEKKPVFQRSNSAMTSDELENAKQFRKNALKTNSMYNYYCPLMWWLDDFTDLDLSAIARTSSAVSTSPKSTVSSHASQVRLSPSHSSCFSICLFYSRWSE